jgi:hypothetical protein
MELSEHQDVVAEIEKAKEWVRRSRELTDNLQFDSSMRSRIAAALFLISLEHQVGILSLMVGGMYAPAKALVRSQIDAHLRGVWFLYMASDEQIREFSEKPYVKDVPPTGYEKLWTDLETVDHYGPGLVATLKKLIKTLHDFTHGGKYAVSAYVSRDEIGANFIAGDIVLWLRHSGVIGLLAASEISGISGIEDLPGRIFQAHADVYGENHGRFDLPEDENDS